MRSKETSMKKGYWVTVYRSIKDETALKEYGKLAIPAIQAGGGKALIRTSDAIEPHESGLKQRVVVMEFESFEKAKAAYHGAAYQAALKVLGSAVDRDLRIVEGVE
jgi:uncharacterized protein (DUF1330 family)